MNNNLKTPYENGGIPFNIYPRPTLKRNSFLNLNGKWDFKVYLKENKIFDGKILVPMPPESHASLVNKRFDKNSVLVYETTFKINENFINDNIILHFGAVDNICEIYVNNKRVGEHVGGYLPFEFNVTSHLKLGKNKIRVIVTDTTDIKMCYGKQKIKRGGMWYTPTSGIWQTVWLESLPKNYIESIKITTNLKSATIKVRGGEKEKTLILEDGTSYSFKGESIKISLENPRLWTPEEPNIYNFKIVSGKDEISSYFALRTIGLRKGNKPCTLLNNKPYFFNGLLDQGYYSDGIYTPFNEQGYLDDILKMKSLGFNMLRKHIKIEPEIFYYYCDIYGMAVFQDFVNNGKYSFLIDTALPTVAFKKGIRHFASKKQKEHFYLTAEKMVEILHNHPSVVEYTIFNEGWGQFKDKNIYDRFKSLDSTRLYDTASGWFYEEKSDFESHHVYFKPIKIKGKKDKALYLSEFGGYSYKLNDHSFNLDKTYGYKNFYSKDDFEEGLFNLYKNEVLPAISQGLCATVLTQVSDVEDETNGLLTYDRQVLKIEKDLLKPIFSEMQEAFLKHNKGK